MPLIAEPCNAVTWTALLDALKQQKDGTADSPVPYGRQA